VNPGEGAAGDPPAIDGFPQRVLRRSLAAIRNFRHQLDALRSAYAEREDLPGLRTLVDAMSALLAETEREIILQARHLHDSLEAGKPPGPAEERFCDLAGGLVNSVDRVFPDLLQMIREPHGREIEALLFPFSDLLGFLNQEEPHSIELIFSPGDEYSYELSVIDRLSRIAEPFTEDLRRLLEEFPKLMAVTYPKQREGDILIHTMIAHEVAHTVLAYIPLGYDDAPILNAFDEAVDVHYDELLRRLGGAGTDEERRQRTEEEIERNKRWFEELACDALALGMIGPGYIFALADFDLTPHSFKQVRGTASFDTHPGLAWRLRRTIARAREEYFPAGRRRGTASSALFKGMDRLEAQLPEPEEEISEQEVALIEAALDNISSEMITDVLRQGRYLRKEFREEVEIVWGKLAAGIPPAERIPERVPRETILAGVPDKWSRPMEWQSIVNGSLAYWLEERPFSPERGPRSYPDRRRIAQDWIDFNFYVRGAIELANLHGQLRDARDSLEELNQPRVS
jgi:hypothetical protein